MNKVLNWTFGSLFRTIGRLLGFLIVCILLVLIGSKLGLKIPDFLMPMKISAAEQTIPYTSDSYFRINTCDVRDTGICSWVSGQTSLGTNKNISSGNTLNAFLVRFYGDFTVNTQYKFIINVSSSPGIRTIHSESSLIRTTTCNGLSGGELSQSVIGGCRLNSVLFEDDSNTVQFIIYATPKSNQDFIQFNLYFNLPLTMVLNSFRVGTSSKITIETSTIDAITDSTNQIIDSQNQTNEKLDNIEDSITNDDTSGAEDSASGFFENFTTETFGLTSIITAPLNAINNILNSSCSSLSIPLPFVNKNIILPCMTTIYTNYFGAFFQLYQLITTGIISYYIIVRIFNLVKDFKNPDHDEIEVVDL